ncbi:diguanylate cyclase domain-containing protein [Hydrogenimonas sp.]
MMHKSGNEWLITVMRCAGVFIVGLFLYREVDRYTDNELKAIAERTTQMERRLLSMELETLENRLGTLASILFDRELSARLASLSEGKESIDEIRRKLLERYAPIYERLHSHNVERLHFYLPDGTVLLRVEKPEKYGDSIRRSRPAVELAIEHRTAVYGFEHGLYRALYPLFHRKALVGIAEFSLPFTPVKRELEKVSPGNIYQTAFEYDRMREIVEKHPDLYEKCSVDPSFVVRRDVHDVLEILRKAGFRTFLIPYRDFSEILSLPPDRHIVVTFLPLSTPDGERGGYCIVLHGENPSVETLLSTSMIVKMTILLVVTVVILLILMIHLYRIKSKEAHIDPLTGIYNRKGCIVGLGPQRKRYALIFIDIDGLGKINEVYGKAKGDAVLRSVTRIIGSHIRREDLFCRYGGDEFLLFIANATEEQARIIADKIGKHISIHRFDDVEKVTIHTGIAIRRRNESIGSLIARAVKDLKKAKGESVSDHGS